MTWVFEIIRAFFVAFGAMQTISNFIYLLKSNGLELARKQHRELPDNTTNKQIKTKILCMFSFGILFLSTGLFSYLSYSYYEFGFIFILGAYTLYTLVEAIYYRFWRTFGAFIISAMLLLILGLAINANAAPLATNKAIEEVNQICNVPFGLTLPESELKNTDKYVRNEGFGCYILENDDVSFTLGGYPDSLDKYHIIEYQIKTTKYTLMGLSVGCTLDEADKVMKQYGYTISTEDNWRSRYTKNGVRIGISLNDDAIVLFHVSVEVTNKENISF